MFESSACWKSHLAISPHGPYMITKFRPNISLPSPCILGVALGRLPWVSMLIPGGLRGLGHPSHVFSTLRGPSCVCTCVFLARVASRRAMAPPPPQLAGTESQFTAPKPPTVLQRSTRCKGKAGLEPPQAIRFQICSCTGPGLSLRERCSGCSARMSAYLKLQMGL